MKRILVENGCYDLRNMGDVAMLQVAVSRLRNLWPDALIEVITNSPALLAKYCPEAQPIAGCGRDTWFEDRDLIRGLLHSISLKGKRRPTKLWRQIRRRLPRLAFSLMQINAKLRKTNGDATNNFFKTICNADMVVVSGGGDINDQFKKYAMTLLDVLELAARRGKVTVMLGQGVGPIHNPKLMARAKSVLPLVDIITIRENRSSPYILEFLGVKREQFVVTGDDAIEPAYRMRSQNGCGGIGVNLRITPYTQASSHHIKMIRAILYNAAKKYEAKLVALPISFQEKESDIEAIDQILANCENKYDPVEELDNPAKLVEQAGRCRVVVTGSYHSAVFALSQGIPVIGLVKSPYYIDKFLGLSEQFGCGCEMILLDDENLADKLTESITAAWDSAGELKPKLLEAARRQIACGQLAYDQIYKLAESKTAERSAKKKRIWAM